MNQTPQKQQAAVSTGIVSLITFFTVLLLTSFAILILSGSNTDLSLALRTADSVTQYYEADSQAELRLKELHDIVLQTPAPERDAALTAAGFTLEASEFYDGLLVNYEVPINEQKMLSVSIGLPSDENMPLERVRWQAVIV